MGETPLNKSRQHGLFKRREKGDHDALDDFALVSQLGFTMALCLVFCFFVGYKLDQWLGSHGVVLAVSIVLGILGGGWTVYRQIRDLYRSGRKR